MASSKKDLLAMPEEVLDAFGYALHLAQIGGKHEHAKPMNGQASRRLGGCRELERRHLPSGLHGAVHQSGLRPALLAKEGDQRHRHPTT
jgi:hypothetical protein